jgi:hypothetical protein
MMVTLDRMYNDFTAHARWFLITEYVTLRIKIFTPSVNKFDELVITQSFQSVF